MSARGVPVLVSWRLDWTIEVCFRNRVTPASNRRAVAENRAIIELRQPPHCTRPTNRSSKEQEQRCERAVMQGAGRIYAPAWALCFWLRVASQLQFALLVHLQIRHGTERFAGNGEQFLTEPCSPNGKRSLYFRVFFPIWREFRSFVPQTTKFPPE